MKFYKSNKVKSSEHGSALPPTTRNVVMRKVLPTALLLLAPVWYSQAAWSFEGFGNFQNMLQTIECVRKPGTDYLVCTNKTDQEDEEEVEPSKQVHPDLFPSVEVYDVTAKDPNLDYIWSHVQSFDITIELDPKIQECKRIGPEADNVYDDVIYDFSMRDLNNDDYQDYLVAIHCLSDVYYEGKIVSREYGGYSWIEPFMAMFCGSEEGLYNCTEELTGHQDVIAVGGDVLPGFLSINKTVLFDINNDGILDAIFAQGNDREGRPTRNPQHGDEFSQAYYDLMGMTRQEIIDACKILKPYSQDNDTCWVYQAEQTYAISGPDGKWEIKKFDIPEIWTANGGGNLYYKDGEYHVNLAGGGITNWHVFNPDTNTFDLLVYGFKPEPWDISENWNQYRIYTDTPDDADYAPWKQIGKNEYRVERKDHSLEKGGVPGTICSDWWDRNYDDCQFEQLHILTKDNSGNVTKVMEYNIEDWIDEKRKVRVQNAGGVSVNSDLSNWSDFASVSYNLHGNWVNVTMGGVILADIRQLETRADAPWYLIVSVEGRNDLRNPGKKFVSEIDYECQPQSMDDEPCLQNASAIVFKYLIDFESNTLTYAGTLLEEEYPFMWIGLDGAGPATWTWKDQNNDGWYDIIVSASDHHHPFVSDDQGTYRYLDRFQVHPIMAYGRNFNHDDKLYDADTYEYIDVTGDGITDFMGVISGSSLTQVLDRWFPGHDPRLNDLYQPDRIYLDIVHGAYDMFTEANVVDYIEVQERMSECIDRAVNTSFTLFEAHRCYNMPWIF